MKIITKLIFASIFLSLFLVLSAVVPGVAHAQYECASHSYERCLGNNIYWYDSCGNLQDLAQYCSYGCAGNTCNPLVYGSCTYHAYKLCVGNNIYWYDSCGAQQDLYINCSGGQTCQYGQCVVAAPVYNPAANYIAQYRIACNGNSLSWYDSLGAASGLYQSCSDNNSCTVDACSANRCSNTLRCDGSTCTIGSDDYNKYCLPAVKGASTQAVAAPLDSVPRSCGNGVCEASLGENSTNCPNDCKSAPVAVNPAPAAAPSPVNAAAAVSAPANPTGFWGFVSRWYLWILGGLVLIFLFVVVFKRLSSDI